MSSEFQTLVECNRRGIRLVKRQGKIEYRGKRKSLPKVIGSIRSNKQALLAILPVSDGTWFPDEQATYGQTIVSRYADSKGAYDLIVQGNESYRRFANSELTPLQVAQAEDFKRLNVEVELIHPSLGRFFLVPRRTQNQDRLELTPEDLFDLMKIRKAFPDSRWEKLSA